MTDEPFEPQFEAEPDPGAPDTIATREAFDASPGAPDFATPPPPPAAEKVPFWGYSDLALLIGCFFASFVAAGLLFAGVMKALPAHEREAVKVPLSLVLQGVIYLLAYLSLHFTLASRYGRPVLPALGWKPPQVSLLVPALGGLVLPFAVSAIIAPFHPPKIDSPFEAFTSSVGLMVCFGILAALLGPVMEELVFRGFLQPLLSRSLGTVAGILITAALFGALHAPEYSYAWQFAAAVGLAGVAFGAMRVWADSTLASSIMHAGFNLVMVLAMLFARAGKH